MSNFDKNENSDSLGSAGTVMEGITTGLRKQTRFTLIPKEHLNIETVAGIRDMTLGRIRNGEPTGAPTIRFDTGLNSRTNPHINIDPSGRPSALNPHIEVSAELVSAASKLQNTLKYAGVTLSAVAIAIDTYRVGKALYDDIYTMKHADELIKEINIAIQKLKETLNNEQDPTKKKDLQESLEFLQKYLIDCKRAKKGIPSETITTASSVAGGLGGGYAGGSGGAVLGAEAGASIGLLLGPVGAVVGAPIGAVVGAIFGGIFFGVVASKAAETVSEEALKLTD